MYPDLSYFFHDIFGTQPDNALSIVKMFGFMLIVAFLASAWALKLELKRKEEEGLMKAMKEKVVLGKAPEWKDLIGNAILGFILGFKIPYIFRHFPEFKEDAAGVLLSPKGYLFWGIVGAGTLAFLKFWELRRKQLAKPTVKHVSISPHQRVGDITILAAISGIIGAKLFAIFESSEHIQAFLRDPIRQLFSGSGLAIYGGLIVAFVVVIWYIRKKQMPALHIMDAAAPALILGYAVGRIGCQLSGDGDWGIVNLSPEPSWWFLPHWLWAYDYPHNVIHEGVMIEGCSFNYCSRLEQPVYPTPIYETVMSLVFFGILWLLRKRFLIPGMLFCLYLILNGVERYLIEKIRVNPDINILGIQATQAEYIAVLFVLLGLGGGYWCWRYAKGSQTAT